jgi:hypothetical protein
LQTRRLQLALQSDSVPHNLNHNHESQIPTLPQQS